MRSKTIILGAIAALALATLSANAGNAPHRTAQGSATSLVAGTAALVKADRAEVAATNRATSAVKTTAVSTTSQTAQKTEVEDDVDALPAPVSQACQTAIDNLKALRQADVAEDTTEKAGQQTASEDETESAADQAEDKTEADQLRNARTAMRAACLPQPSAACQAALASLKALRDADVTEDASEKAAQTSVAPESAAAKAEDMAEADHVRTALMAIRTACGEREGEHD